MKNKIKVLENDIESNFLKASLNSELNKIIELLEVKYNSLKKNIENEQDEFVLRKYYADLLVFNEIYISYALTLIKNKKNGISIYDLSTEEISSKIDKEIGNLDKIISYMKDEFPTIGEIIEKKLEQLKDSYNESLSSGMIKDKNNVEIEFGITSKTVLSLGNTDIIKRLFLNRLEIFDDFFLKNSKKVIENNLLIVKKYINLTERLEKLSERSEEIVVLINKLNALFDDYKKNTSTISINQDVNDICNSIIRIEDDFKNRFRQFENNMEAVVNKAKRTINIEEKLHLLGKSHITREIGMEIDMKEILNIIRELKDTDEIKKKYFEYLYSIIVAQLLAYNSSALYNSLDSSIKNEIEKMFVFKLKKFLPEGQERDDYLATYIKNGFNVLMLLDVIDNIDELRSNTCITDSYSSIRDADNFVEGLICVRNQSGLWGFMDETGKEVIECKYKDASSFSEGLACVKNSEGLCGFIDKTGKEVIECKYEDVGSFNEGLASVKNLKDLWGFIDKTGKEVIKCKYVAVDSFSEGLASVKNSEGLCGFIDKTGKEVIECKYEDAGSFIEGLARVKTLKDLYGFIDKTGKEVIECKYEDAGSFSEGLVRVKSLEGLWGFIDKTGKEVIECKHWIAGPFNEGLACVKSTNIILCGFIDKTGKEVIECKYEYAGPFSEGLACVKNLEGLREFINTKGEVVITRIYRSSINPKISVQEFSESIKYKSSNRTR